MNDTPDTDVPNADDMPTTDRVRGRERFALTQADRLLAERLADIDHLRDVAMRNGNTRLLDQADYLEQLARAQYSRRTAGFDVPGTDGPTDPMDPLPPTDPTTPMDPTFPMDPMTPTDPSPPTDLTDPPPTDPGEPGEVILGDIEPVEGT